MARPLQNTGYTSVGLLCNFLFLIFFAPPAAGVVNFSTCLAEVQSGKWGPIGGTDNHGHPVSNITMATALTYDLCTRVCGAGPEPSQWSVFSQRFGSWLLPWLALVSQLPFGGNDKLDNLMSMLLTVGSPTLAAYSLALTVLNGRWITRLFAPYSYPNTKNAVRILISLQQAPITVTTTGALLSSLVVLPGNDEWWNELVMWLDYTHTWSISAVTSITWVAIAYVFTVIDSFTGDITVSLSASGQGVGSLWLWLLPIVTGWLQISPKCDSIRLHQAVKRANRMAYIATPSGEPKLANTISQQQAISLSVNVLDNAVRRDEVCTPPVFNYARFLPWVQAVEEISDVFRAASSRAHAHISVDPDVKWEGGGMGHSGPHLHNRLGTADQIDAYCDPHGEFSFRRRSHWGHGIWSRFFAASILALLLQWCTTGAAVVVVWFTPTQGLGCRSGAYLLYGTLSTAVWAALVLSSFLSHYSSTTPRSLVSSRIAGWVSIFLRRFGKIIAALNAVWLAVSCLFQFSNFFDRCYCNGSVLGLGVGAYNVIAFTSDDISSTRSVWIGGIVVAAGSSALFIMFVSLFVSPLQAGSEK